MSQSLSKVYLHIVFSTKERTPWIDHNIEKEVHSYLAKICSEIGCNALEIGGMQDHLHLLVLQSRTVTISKLLETVKSNSSKWIKSKGSQYTNFCWQKGYGGFSVDQTTLPAVKNYILNQKEHHQKRGFQDEYRMILKRYEVEYDERYVWE